MKKASFLDHLEELRKRLIYSIACVGFFSIIGLFFSKRLLNFIIQKMQLKTTYFFSLPEAFTAQIIIAIFLGIFISFPFILYQVWAFVGPGMTQKEQKISITYLGSGIILFLIGNLFAYFILIPFGSKFLLSFGTECLQPLMNISKILTFIFWCLLGSGFLFQMPLLLFFLIKLDIIELEKINKHRTEAIVVILIICAIITPTGDIFTLLLISVPLLLLFELSILAARISQRTNRRKRD